MIKTLLAQVKEFKKASFLTPVFMILEVVVETMIPLVMADMIDNGVEAGNISIYTEKVPLWRFLLLQDLLPVFLGENTEHTHPPVLPVIFVKQCIRTFRHFHIQTLTSSVLQV